MRMRFTIPRQIKSRILSAHAGNQLRPVNECGDRDPRRFRVCLICDSMWFAVPGMTTLANEYNPAWPVDKLLRKLEKLELR